MNYSIFNTFSEMQMSDKDQTSDVKQNLKSTEKEKPQSKEELSPNNMRINAFIQTFKGNRPLNLILRYGLSILIVIVAFLLYQVLTIILGPGLPTYILFYPAIIIVALLAGFRPGILATFISVILAGIWILPPVGQFSIDSTVDQVSLILFSTIGILISVLAELYHKNRIKAAAYEKEQALRETRLEKEFLADILKNASQPFAIGYPNGKLGLHNNAFNRLTGYNKEELDIVNWSNTLTPFEWRKMEEQKLAELIRTGQPVRYEKEYIRKDGSRVPIELLVSATLDGNGEPKYYYSFLTDISERKKAEQALKESEEKYRNIIENIQDAYFRGNKEGKIIMASPSAADLYRYDSPEEMIGLPALAVYKNDEDRDFVLQELKNHGNLTNNEVSALRKDGTTFWASQNAQYYYDEEGEIQGTEAFVRDITKLKVAEENMRRMLKNEQQLSEELQTTNEELQSTTEELRTSNEELQSITEELQVSNEELLNTQDELTETIKKLEASNKELEQFAYVASHDLQEPLRMVASFTQLLEKKYKDNLDKDADEYIDFIVEGANRMKDLIDDLLIFSRLNTEKKAFQNTDLNQLLKNVIFGMKSTIEKENAYITYDSLPVVRCDSSQMNQVFQNLISNSIKFHETPPRIHISAEENTDEWILGVSDEGIGIDPSYQQKIFDVFRRLHTREEYAGTGIGLSICKRIVERHGGRIWVESEPNKGANFYFTILK